MFPDQNVHYTKNFSIGYPGVNFIKATEYHGKFNYDRGKAIRALEGSSPRYKRRGTSIADPNGYIPQARKYEGMPTYPQSLPSVDNRQSPYYPESVPPLDEAPPSATLDRKVDQLLIEDQTRREEEAIKKQMLQLPLEQLPYQPSYQPPEDYLKVAEPSPRSPQEIPPAYEKPSEVNNNSLASKRPAALSYREELDHQIQLKQQQKRDAIESAKAFERQMVKDWQAEQDKVSRAKAEETRRVQEMTRQYYERQMQEREDRLHSNRGPQERNSLPPASTRNTTLEEKQVVVESRRKIADEMERLEREKERVRHELLTKDSMITKAKMDPMGFLQDVNRERFKQKITNANKKQEAIYRDYVNRMFPEVVSTEQPSINAVKATLDQQMALQNVSKRTALMEKAREKEQMDALLQMRKDEDRSLGEQRRQQQEYYRSALDQQKTPKEAYNLAEARKDRAALAMEAGIDPYRSNPIVGPGSYRAGVHSGHGSILKEAALNALHSK